MSIAQAMGVANDPIVPRSLPNKGAFGFTLRQLYPWDQPSMEHIEN